jgi:hypothetical protein
MYIMSPSKQRDDQTETPLVTKLEATVRRDDTTSRPRAIRRAEHGDGACDLLLVCLRETILVSFGLFFGKTKPSQ